MKSIYFLGLLSIWMVTAPVVGHAQGSSGSTASTAIPVTLPVFQDSWAMAGKMGDRYTVPLRKVGDVIWYTFKLEDDLVIYAQHFGTASNYASVELLDKDSKPIAKSNDDDSSERIIYNAKLKAGTYFLKVTCVESDGKPFMIELSKFSKKQTDEGERQIEALKAGQH